VPQLRIPPGNGRTAEGKQIGDHCRGRSKKQNSEYCSSARQILHPDD